MTFRRMIGMTAHATLVACAVACSEGASRPRDASPPPPAASAVPRGAVVDSVRPVEEDLQRFQAALGPAPSRLAGGAPSRDSLFGRFVTAVQARDSAALRGMALTVEEFAWLVYPGSSYTRPPYRQSAEIVWLQVEQAGEKGLRRLMRPEVATSLRPLDYACAPDAVVDAASRLWRDCRVRVVRAGGDTVSTQLFGVIVERDGQFKFVNYQNDY